jgi:hypothetical protein
MAQKTISHQQFAKQTKIVRDLEQVFFDALRKTQKLLAETGWQYDDIRISMFGKLSGILNSAVVSLYFLQNHLTHRTWWEATYGDHFKIFEPAVSQTISCFDGQARSGLHLGLVANAESAFRILVRTIDPKACNRAEAVFANIYESLLVRTDNIRDKPIYDLLRLMRNTKLHSDGVYRSGSSKDARVIYRGNTYEFKFNTPFTGVSWELVTKLAQDTLDSMLRIVHSRDVYAAGKILDPQHV